MIPEIKVKLTVEKEGSTLKAILTSDPPWKEPVLLSTMPSNILLYKELYNKWLSNLKELLQREMLKRGKRFKDIQGFPEETPE